MTNVPDFMDGTYLSGTEVQQVLDISRQRLHQLVRAGALTAVPTPLGPLFLRDEIDARAADLETLRRRWLEFPEVCRGKAGPHRLTPENVMWSSRGDRTWRCRPCVYLHTETWRMNNPDRARAIQKRADAKAHQKRREQRAALPATSSAGAEGGGGEGR